MIEDFEKIFAQTFPGFLSIRDENHKIIYMNENFCNWVKNYTDVNPLGKTNVELAELVPQNVADTFLQCHDGSLELQKNGQGKKGISKVIEFKSNDSNSTHSQYFEVIKYNIQLKQQSHIFTIAYDITELYVENQDNHYAALTDSMTKAYNRRYIEANKEMLEGHPCVAFDLDKFKLINDLQGHATGDKILKEFVLFLMKIEGLVTVVRLGGDEFLGIFRTDIDSHELRNVLSNQRKNYEQQYKQFPYFSFSFGIGNFKQSIDETISLIDPDLYQDKKRDFYISSENNVAD